MMTWLPCWKFALMWMVQCDIHGSWYWLHFSLISGGMWSKGRAMWRRRRHILHFHHLSNPARFAKPSPVTSYGFSLTWLHHNNLQQFLGNITSIKVHKQFMQNLLSKLFLLHTYPILEPTNPSFAFFVLDWLATGKWRVLFECWTQGSKKMGGQEGKAGWEGSWKQAQTRSCICSTWGSTFSIPLWGQYG